MSVKRESTVFPIASISLFQAFKYRKSSIKPLGGHLFQVHLRGGGGLIETGGLILENTMLSVLHKELEYKVENLKYKKVGGHVVCHTCVFRRVRLSSLSTNAAQP